MSGLFWNVAVLGFAATVAALAVMVIRGLVGKRLPRSFVCILWGVVILRMILPVSFSAPFSLTGLAWTGIEKGSGIVMDQALFDSKGRAGEAQEAQTAMAGLDNLGPEAKLGGEIPAKIAGGKTSAGKITGEHSAGRMGFLEVAVGIWAAAAALLAGRHLVGYVRLDRSLRTACLFRGTELVEKCRREAGLRRSVPVYLWEQAEVPFVFGVLKPRVVLPLSAAEEDGESLRYILLHEFCHIKRLDYLTKPAACFALCLHWFNPLLWLAVRLFVRDMEMACDERAVFSAEQGERTASEGVRGEQSRLYAGTLLALAVNGGNGRMSGLLTFNESDVGKRVKHIVAYRKPRRWICALCAAAVCLFGVVMLANPVTALQGENGGETVLVLGSLEGSGRVDSAALVRCDFDSGELGVLLLPRKMMMDDPQSSDEFGRTDFDLDEYVSQFGPQEAMGVLGEMTGVSVDHYVHIDDRLLRAAVDAMGGVRYEVPTRMIYEDPYQNLTIDLETGMQTLDGQEVLDLLRYRKGSRPEGEPTGRYARGELGRMETQAEVIEAMLRQWEPERLLTSKEVWGALKEGVETDLTAAELADLVRQAAAGGWKGSHLHIQALTEGEQVIENGRILLDVDGQVLKDMAQQVL